ncbi:hypothetical protein [Epilithonimonas arachidiradicis]|uniref:Uncharacterized protein n=1 Tax=Epilithonimonas arachidiradicis TaxID=1617282 RepID=A0A420DCC0_9FLAO|nr:hypothetical protein [Epilithonimonas arachidiradicis]RKE89492.1 hypothetical protein BXY58_0054 [Epilithonimonas arachidiradicis]GGG42857.1 hypothetical protein GCM10007332_00490 [Epilithonimonas arachidiradicis]
MKTFSFLISLLLLLQSCTTAIYRNNINKNDFSAVETGKRYTFYENNKPKYKVRVSAVEDDKIVGVTNNQEVTIAKNDIRVIKKNNSKGTTAIVVGSVVGVAGFVALIAALVNNSTSDYYYY